MSNQVLYPIRQAKQMVDGFLDGTLPKGDFTHEAHLICALHLLSRYGADTLPVMRRHLAQFLTAAGVPQSDTMGYHETLTVFWLAVLQDHFAGEDGRVSWNQETLDELLFEEKFSDRNLWLEYYTRERMMSVEARREFLEPDKKPFSPSAQIFLSSID